MAIIISKDGKDAQKVDKVDFDNEDYMQEYIHNNPDAIPVYEIQKDKKLFVAKREFPTNSGPIDALAFDQDGDIYIVETKLFRNPDKRTVVAQALDYGAVLWKHSNDFDVFVEMLDMESQKNFNLDFQDKLREFFGIDDEQLKNLIRSLQNNLNVGNLKFVILMDAMDERLKDLIIYINQNSQFDIYAVQLEYYKHDEFEIIIPKIFGVEVKKNIKSLVSGNSRKQWNEDEFIAQTKELLTLDSKKIITFYRYFVDVSDKINWGSGKIDGSFAPIFNKLSKTTAPFSLFANGDIMIKLGWFSAEVKKGNLSEAKWKGLISNFEKIWKEETNITMDVKLNDNVFTVKSKDVLRDYQQIMRVFERFVEDI